MACMDLVERFDACMKEAGFPVEGVRVIDLGLTFRWPYELADDVPFHQALYRAYLLSGAFAVQPDTTDWCMDCWVAGFIAGEWMTGSCPCRMSTESGESASCPPSGDPSVTTDRDEVQVGS